MLLKSKLITLLNSLSSKELKQFEDYINSPIFNKNQNLVIFLQQLKRYYPNFEKKLPTWEFFHQQLFPSEKIEEQRLRYAMSDLTKLLEDYLAFADWLSNPIKLKLNLLNSYRNRKLSKYFEQQYIQLNQQLKQETIKGADYYLSKFQLEEAAFLNELNKEDRNTGVYLQEAVDNLDYFYLYRKTLLGCVIYNQKDVLQVNYHDELTESILQIIKDREFKEVPGIKIYYQILMTHLEPSKQEHYTLLLEMLLTHDKYFSQEETSDLYSFVLNYCIKQLNNGNLAYLKELYQLYKILLEKEILFDEGILSPSDYKNIVITGLRSNEFEWTHNFIESFKKRLPQNLQQSTYLYNLAFYHFYMKEFSKALKLLMQSDFNDIYFQLDAKSLLLKTYYELKEDEPFFNLTDAFGNYLKRNKLISDYQRNTYLNFVKFSKKIMNQRNGGKQTKEQISEELNETKPIASLQWLQEKINELKK